MREKKFRNRVAESSWTLPLTAIFTAIVWALPNTRSASLWIGLAVMAVATYITVELNNQFQLLRIRSRMTSATYLALMAAFPVLHPWQASMGAALCLLVASFMTFRSYQQMRPEGYVFHAFLFLGVGAWLFPPMLVLALPLFAGMGFCLRVMTWRTFAAALLGVATPFWFLFTYAAWTETISTAFLPWVEQLTPAPLLWLTMSLPELAATAFLAPIAIVSVWHYIHTSYNDKIRVRMFFYVLSLLQLTLTALFIVLPQHFHALFQLLLLNSSPFIAHYFTLARGRWMNAWFVLWLLALIAIGVLNYFNLWMLFFNS